MTLSNSSKAFVVILVVLVAAVATVAWWLVSDSGAGTGERGEPVTFVVPQGASSGELAGELADADVVSSAWAFRLAARFDDRTSRIQAGEHELRTGMSSDEVLEALASAPEIDTFRVTIPEGLTVEQIVPRLADASGHDTDELVGAFDEVTVPDWVPVDELPDGAQPFEGLLFPDTYQFRDDAAPVDVVQRLVDETAEVVGGIEPPEGYTDYELLTVASIVEREARLPEERPTVASVIYNRLDEPMRLQVDATVQYAQGEHSERLLFSDLEVDSDWNTYERDGLPPTPISAPGRSAIEAAADPDDTDYLYYVVNDLETGSHAFAETQAGHEANVAEFRRLREEREQEQQE